ncbi:MAG TPA: FAD-dependent oxidoreductase, partial [Candidatus Andersenbacteria bacterium]|nr:FAD-dependent oxidoreductase [Candidatus Andersenbacteria bacterium]
MGSLWDDIIIDSFSPLSSPLEVDVAIIGAGITGLTTACMLANTGLRVAVVEKDRIGFGATGITTAFLTQYIDTLLFDFVRMFGEEKTKAIISSHAQAIDSIEKLIQDNAIRCDFERCPLYIYANEKKEISALQKEKEIANIIGIDMQMNIDSELGFSEPGYLVLPHQAKFHPLKYVKGLVNILRKKGVQIFEHTEVTNIGEGDRITIATPHAPITATHAVVATYVPLQKKLFFKKAFYTTYVFELSCPHGAIPEGIYEDTLDPYHYLRVDHIGGKDRVLIGGEDHRSDIHINDDKCFAALEHYTEELLRDIPFAIKRKWSGPIIESIDGLAWIGPHESDRI